MIALIWDPLWCGALFTFSSPSFGCRYCPSGARKRGELDTQPSDWNTHPKRIWICCCFEENWTVVCFFQWQFSSNRLISPFYATDNSLLYYHLQPYQSLKPLSLVWSLAWSAMTGLSQASIYAKQLCNLRLEISDFQSASKSVWPMNAGFVHSQCHLALRLW